MLPQRLRMELQEERKKQGAQSKYICDCKGTVHPEDEEQSGEPKGAQF
jgi:hypothetical protein